MQNSKNTDNKDLQKTKNNFYQKDTQKEKRNFFDKDTQKENKSFFKKIAEELRERDERQVRERLEMWSRFFMIAVAAFLIGGARLPFSCFPIAIALMCTARASVLAVIIGITPRFISGDIPALYIFVCFATLMIRILAELLPRVMLQASESRTVVPYSEDHTENQDGTVIFSRNGLGGAALFNEPIHVRALCAAIGGVMCGLFLLIEQEYSFYSLLSALTLTLISPVAVLALGGVFGANASKNRLYYISSLCLTFVLCIYAASSKSLLGMPMAPFLAMLFTLYVCSDKGIAVGVCTAILCGVALDLKYLPLLVLSAILFTVVSSLKRNAGLAAVCAIIVVWCYYIGGAQGLVEMLPPMLLSIPAYMLADRLREVINPQDVKEKAADGKTRRTIRGVLFTVRDLL